MRLSSSLKVPTSVCLISAALFTATCSDSSHLTGTGGAGGNGTGGAAGAIGAGAGTAGAAGAAPQQCIASQPIEPCPANQVCDLDAPSRCGPDSILFGHCIVTPQTCANDEHPVCGCDGRTYSNDCLRQMAQAQLDYTGVCHDAGASTNCGPMNCDPTQSYCLQKQEWNASETYACNAIPADCASNPTCACICPDRTCAGDVYLCGCSDSDGLFAVSCGFNG